MEVLRIQIVVLPVYYSDKIASRMPLLTGVPSPVSYTSHFTIDNDSAALDDIQLLRPVDTLLEELVTLRALNTFPET